MGRTYEIVQGEKKTITFITIDRVLLTPVDITGAFCYFGVVRLEGELPLFQKDNDPAQSNTGVVLTDPVNGVWTATMDRADTLTEDPGDLKYGAWVRLDPGGPADDPESVSRGLIKLRFTRVVFA